MEIYFIVLAKSGKPRKFKLCNEEFVILGRSKSLCQVPLDDDQCSSTHCKVYIKRGEAFIEDLKSKNGVYLNGVRILKQRFYVGDKIQLGDHTISIDKSRIDEEDERAEGLIYQGQFGRGVGNLTLELDAKINVSTNSGIHKKIISPLLKEARRKAYATERKKEKKIISKTKKQTLQYLAFVVDLAISLGFFFVIVTIIKSTIPLPADVDQTRSFLRLVFSGDMQYQVIISIFLSIVILGINRNLPSGSIGEQIFKIN